MAANGVAQEPAGRTGGFADAAYYLVDSLVLEELTQPDVILIDSCLALYHNAHHDTDQINALSLICQQMMNNQWGQYQIYQYQLILEGLTKFSNLAVLSKLNHSLSMALNNLGYYNMLKGEIDTAIIYYNASLEQAKKNDDKEGIALNYNNMGQMFYNMGNYNKALDYFESSIRIKEELRDLNGLANSYLNIASIYLVNGDIAKAKRKFLRSLKNYHILNDKNGMSVTFSWLGSLYNDLGNISLALKCYHNSLTLAEFLGNQEMVATNYLIIGNLYDEQGQFDESMKYYDKSIRLNKKIEDKLGLAANYRIVGNKLEKRGELDSAMYFFNKSMVLFKELKSEEGFALNLMDVGDILLAKNKFDEAVGKYKDAFVKYAAAEDKKGMAISSIRIGKAIIYNQPKAALLYAEQGIVLAQELGYPQAIRDAAAILSNIYELQGKGMKSLEFYKLHVQMKDSINNEATQKATIRQQTQYEFEKAQIVKENETKEQARLEVEATGRRNNLQYSLIFLGILVLFVGILLMGFIKVSPNIAEGIIFFAFLILFEFVLVFTEPYFEQYTNGEPMYNLLANSVLALVIFPLHAILEKLLKKRIVK